MSATTYKVKWLTGDTFDEEIFDLFTEGKMPSAHDAFKPVNVTYQYPTTYESVNPSELEVLEWAKGLEGKNVNSVTDIRIQEEVEAEERTITITQNTIKNDYALSRARQILDPVLGANSGNIVNKHYRTWCKLQQIVEYLPGFLAAHGKVKLQAWKSRQLELKHITEIETYDVSPGTIDYTSHGYGWRPYTINIHGSIFIPRLVATRTVRLKLTLPYPMRKPNSKTHFSNILGYKVEDVFVGRSENTITIGSLTDDVKELTDDTVMEKFQKITTQLFILMSALEKCVPNPDAQPTSKDLTALRKCMEQPIPKKTGYLEDMMVFMAGR